MKIVYSFYLLVIASTFTLQSILASGAQKPKTALTEDESAPGGIFPHISNWTGFQINYSGQPIVIGLTPDKPFDAPALLIGFPAMGHYRGELYNLRKRLALIQFNPKDSAQNMPEKLRELLSKQLAI